MPLLTINSKSCNLSTQKFISTASQIQKTYALLLQLLLRLKKKIMQWLQLKHSENPKHNSNSNAHQSPATSFGRIAKLKKIVFD